MSLKKIVPPGLRRLGKAVIGSIRHPGLESRGQRLGNDHLPKVESTPRTDYTDKDNPLHSYFDSNVEGPGIHKWLHYFEVYHKHLAKFIGREVTILEIGVYSGGSLGMWLSYFGPQAKIIGMDIEPKCKVYERENIHVVIGDQEDRGFWKRFWADTPPVDIIIDDGGHTPSQQMVTMEECLAQLKPGGVYICEDVHGVNNSFHSFVSGLTGAMNDLKSWDFDMIEEGGNNLGASTPATQFQSYIHSMHWYPYILVLERREKSFTHISNHKHGTDWQPHQ